MPQKIHAVNDAAAAGLVSTRVATVRLVQEGVRASQRSR
jgi:hypothetical protein